MYTKTNWQQDITALGPTNLNKIEQGIEDAHNDKVDKEAGKGLSTNDYTGAEKGKLAGIAVGANKYIHPSTHPASLISDFVAAVRATILTGLSTATNATITATDTVLSAFGKLQAQINSKADSNHNHSGVYEPANSNIVKKNVTTTLAAQFTAQNNTAYTTKQIRNITLSTANPSGGSNGDIWVKYDA